MGERQTMRVECLTRERRRAFRVLPFADERVFSHCGLNPDLVPLAGLQPHLDQRRVGERLDDAVVGDRLRRLRITRRGLLLDQRLPFGLAPSMIAASARRPSPR